MQSEHCCEQMNFFLNEHKVAIEYRPPFREYNILLRESNTVQGIDYCPWCGAKLPKELRNEYFDALRNEYELDIPILGRFDNPALPDELKSDEWWKKRGL